MTWTPDLPEGNEARKIKYDIVRYTRGKVLDLGSGPWKPFPHFIGIDTRDEWTDLPWNPDIIMDATNLSIFATKSIDAVFSSHLLQELDDPAKVLTEWWRVVKPGGYLVLYLPDKEAYPSPGEKGRSPLYQHDFDHHDITKMMLDRPLRIFGGFNLVENALRTAEDEYSFFQVYEKRHDRSADTEAWCRKPRKSAVVLRYGGIGDSLQAASILPQLKDEGYHVTFLTQPDGKMVLEYDPHIDEFFIVDRGQVPMEELTAFWESLRPKYSRFINLTESVEVGLLPVPGMTAHKWPKNVRHARFNVNYLEFTHDIAGLPYEPHVNFYPNKKERTWAATYKKKKGGRIIMWVVGSSIHKVCPYMDQIIARLLVTYPDVKILLVGEELDRILDTGWENEPRVIKKAGKWSVRETLAFAGIADLVIGAETGVMNAVSFIDVPKIITLSHSSIENLTRDWVNCSSITPKKCDCYPCHQLNSSFRDCKRDEATGVADCQAKVDPEDIWTAVRKYLGD